MPWLPHVTLLLLRYSLNSHAVLFFSDAAPLFPMLLPFRYSIVSAVLLSSASASAAAPLSPMVLLFSHSFSTAVLLFNASAIAAAPLSPMLLSSRDSSVQPSKSTTRAGEEKFAPAGKTSLLSHHFASTGTAASTTASTAADIAAAGMVARGLCRTILRVLF